MSSKWFFVIFAVTLDFLLRRFKISVDCRICHVPGGVKHQSQCLWLESLNYAQVWVASCSPQLNSVGPDWLYDYVVDDQLILWRDSWDFLPTSQYILHSSRSIAFLFVLMCFCSMLIFCPSTFRDILLHWHLVEVGHTGWRWGSPGQFPFLVVTVICTDFVSLALMRHFSSHVWISESCVWKILDAISGSLCAANIAVSSAYVATVTSLLIGRSAAYKVYRTGPSTLPCGTPDLIGWHSDMPRVHIGT